MSNALENQQRLTSVKTFGAKGDGVTDDSTALGTYTQPTKIAGATAMP